MNCFDARPVRNIDDRLDLQVTFSGSGGSCTVSFVRQPNVQRAGVSLGIDRDGRDVQIAAGADDAHRDLSAISNQNFSKHQVIKLLMNSLAGGDRISYQLWNPAGKYLCG